MLFSTTSWTFLFFFAGSILFKCEADNSYPSKNQDVTIKRLTNLMTDFPSYDQFQALLNNVSGNCYNEEPWSTIQNDALNKIKAELTAMQYATLLGKVSQLTSKMGSSALTSTLNKVITVLGNNLSPFFTQLQNYVKSLKQRGLKEQGVVKNGYRITNTFCSKKRVKTIFTRVSLQFNATDWEAIVSSFEGVFQFEKNGF